MELRRICSILFVCAVAATVMAKPARRDGFRRTAPDGTEKIVFLHGDEDFHYMTDGAGNWLDEESLEPLSAEVKAARIQRGQARSQMRRVRQQENGVGDEPNIAPRGLLVMVNFQDVQFSTPVDTIDSMLNGENFTRDYSYTYSETVLGTTYSKTFHIKSSGSVRRYFEDQSYNQYRPVFDVVGPVTVSQNMAYYGRNYGDQDMRPEEMIQEACRLADSQFGVDFTEYDNDHDGLVDFVYVIYAGYGEADGGGENTIWPHQWNLWDYGRISCIIDGKKLNRYACGSELSFTSKQYDGIGTICHEFSHVLGLPDLYSTSSNTTHKTMGAWDVMDYGPYNNDGNTPPSYSAYERFCMGWITPRVLTEPENVTLHPLESSREALIMCDGDTHNLVGWNPDPKTYYIIEARNKSGWDRYLPGHGMLLTKINFSYNKWSNNTVNNSASSMGVDLIEADGSAPGSSDSDYLGKATDAFPAGAKQYTKFEDHEITRITRQGAGTDIGTITFKYRGGWFEDIEQAESGDKQIQSEKVLRDGQLLIIRNGRTYNASGTLLR